MREKEILPFAATWTDLEGTTLNDASDSERQVLSDIAYM